MKKKCLLQLFLLILITLIPYSASKAIAFPMICNNLHKKLSSCTAYSCYELNPVFPLTFTKHEIIGLENNKCLYKQNFPNNGNMICKYSTQTIADISQMIAEFTYEYIDNIKTIEKKDKKDKNNIHKNQNNANFAFANYDHFLNECILEETNINIVPDK